MDPENIQHEILFFTGTSFAQKEFRNSEQTPTERNLSLTDKLEQAFWNGLLFEMLPELKTTDEDDRQKYLWQINVYRSALWLNLGKLPESVDCRYSVDPYQFYGKTIIN